MQERHWVVEVWQVAQGLVQAKQVPVLCPESRVYPAAQVAQTVDPRHEVQPVGHLVQPYDESM